MKRAAVQWGIGRYLYNIKAGWATINMTDGSHSNKIKDKNGNYVWFKWDSPALPQWALPGDEPETDEQKSKRLWTSLSKEHQEHLKNLAPEEKIELFVKSKFDKKMISEMCEREIVEARR